MTPWQCHAKPAALGGKTCGHLNTEDRAVTFHEVRLAYCSSCGCTRIASDLRKPSGAQTADLFGEVTA